MAGILLNEINYSGGSIPDYSTTEMDTGRTWIDGRKIYSRVGVFPSNTTISTTWVEVPNFALGDGCLILSLFATSETGTFTPVQGATSVSATLSNNLNIKLITGSVTVKTVIAEYVKAL